MMELEEITKSVSAAAEELIRTAKPKQGCIFVLGCSTSEVLGARIGTLRSPETAEAVVAALLKITRASGLFLAVQCCEHLNRALVIEEEVMERFGLTQVTVHPVPEAGGSAASVAYDLMEHPVVVEKVTADLGMDIGQTLIGMHLKRVAVPVRLGVKTVGNAVVTAARTRPPLIGGERAKYF